jgi:hypothetical protein
MAPARSVPTIVARGMRDEGSRTLSAGIVAHSRPRNAQSVNVITATSAVGRGVSVAAGRLKDVRLQEEQTAEAHDHQRQDLERRRHDLHLASRSHASGIDRDDDPHCPHRQRGRGGRVAHDRRDERIEIADEGHRQRGERAHGREPIAPCDQEAGYVAERMTRVGVGTA